MFWSIAEAQHAIFRIVTLAAIGTGDEAANVRAPTIEVLSDGKCSATTAWDEEHAVPVWSWSVQWSDSAKVGFSD